MNQSLHTVLENVKLLFQEQPQLFESSYNTILIEYWRRFDRLGDITLKPDEITNYLSIDRCIRKLRSPTKERLERIPEFVDLAHA
jgi:hypothetical protein